MKNKPASSSLRALIEADALQAGLEAGHSPLEQRAGQDMSKCRYCSKWGPCPEHDATYPSSPLEQALLSQVVITEKQCGLVTNVAPLLRDAAAELIRLRLSLEALQREHDALKKAAVSWMDGEPGWPCGCGHDVDTYGVPVTFYDRCEHHTGLQAALKAITAEMRELAGRGEHAHGLTVIGWSETLDALVRPPRTGVLMPDPDFDQIAWRHLRDPRTTQHIEAEVAAIAEQLRQVWNARGVADARTPLLLIASVRPRVTSTPLRNWTAEPR